METPTPPPPPPPSSYGDGPPPPPPRRDFSDGGGFDPNLAKQRLLAPGIALTAAAAIGIMYILYSLIAVTDPSQQINQFLDIYREMDIEFDQELADQWVDMAARFQKPMLFMQLVSQCLIMASGISMIRMRSWNVCVAGAILALIPCLTGCCCCFVDLPLGIWALVVLNDAAVKQAFT
ncbi:MAG: hypothetical protein QNK37_02495 [Acidobacteriota bacterium]|nr:hypothetical protein [Acidobacteriota bacterium]